MQMNFFTAGLGDPLMTDVEVQKPTDLQHAMSLARTYEARNAAMAEAAKNPLARSAPRPFSSAGKAPTSDALAPSVAGSVVPTTSNTS